MSKKTTPSKQLLTAVKKAVIKHGYEHDVAFIAKASPAKTAAATCPPGYELKRIQYVDDKGRTIIEHVCMPV
jgi:hypothetical protein